MDSWIRAPRMVGINGGANAAGIQPALGGDQPLPDCLGLASVSN
jgi:hypothetical protein